MIECPVKTHGAFRIAYLQAVILKFLHVAAQFIQAGKIEVVKVWIFKRPSPHIRVIA